MRFIILYFIICFAIAELITNITVEIYYDTLGQVYLSYEKGYINRILNPDNFQLSAGTGKVTFHIKNHDIILMNYIPQHHLSVKASEDYYSPIFINTIYIGIFRGANRRDKTKCTTIAKAKEYVRYVELSMRLWSGNQVRIAQNEDLYISSQCLVIDESIYVEGNRVTINNALYAEAKKIDNVPDVASRWFINDDYIGGWLGLAVIGSPMGVANRNSNYWLICKYNPSVEDPTNSKLVIIVHEFGHNCGFGHGGTQGTATTGTFVTFNEVDNYNDAANFMGVYTTWRHPIIASQYRHVVVGGKPEPWLFKDLEEGFHKYRIYAIDHPYTRHFLGVKEAYHSDDEVFGGISFKYNCMAIRIFINKTMTSKYNGTDGTSGSIMLEYRYDPLGQQGPQEFGVRITYGFGAKGNLLMANIDYLQSWGDSEIIIGNDYYPRDFDTGTLKVRITKIHKTVLRESIEKEIIKDNRRNYDEPAYAELEIEFLPNSKPPTLSPPKDLPNFIFSPSYHNCFKLDDGSGYNCSISTTNSGWYYFVNNGSRTKNIPRIYNNKNGFIKGRNSLRSYNGLDFSFTKVCYGDNGFKCINVSINLVDYPDLSSYYYFNTNVTRIKIGDNSQKVEYLGIKNVIYGDNIEIPEGGRVYITDLFGNEKDIKINNKDFVQFFPTLETDGFAEGAVVVKDKSGKVTYYDSFTVYHQENGNRVAIEYEDDGKFILSPAVMPDDEHSTTTSMLYPVTFKANNWYNYPILRLDYNDYVFVDFRGNVPYDLKIAIETDMGEYSRDLNAMGGLSSVSYKLTFKELNRATSGWAEIDRIKFNKDVEIQNIRPIYLNKIGNQMESVYAKTNSFDYDGYKYTFDCPYYRKYYIYNKVSIDINGYTFSFNTTTSKYIVDSLVYPTIHPTTTLKPTTLSPTSLPTSTSIDPTFTQPTNFQPSDNNDYTDSSNYDTNPSNPHNSSDSNGNSDSDGNTGSKEFDMTIFLIGVAVGVVVVLLVILLIGCIIYRMKAVKRATSKEVSVKTTIKYNV